MRRITVTLAAAACAMSCGGEPSAARVGSRAFSRSDMLPLLEGFQGDSTAMEAFMSAFLDRQLVLADAHARGLDTLPEVESMMYERRRERLQYAYLSTKLSSIVIPEDSVRSFYERMGTQAVYTVVNTEDSALAESLRTLVLRGADMGELASAHSTFASRTGRRDGREGPTDLLMLQRDDSLLLAGLAVGEVSEVECFRSGWRFARLDSLVEVPKGSYEVERQGIYDFIWAHVSEQYKRGLEDSLRSAYGLTACPGVPELIAAHSLDALGTFTAYSDSEAFLPAYTWRGGERTVLSLATNIREIPPFMPRDARDPEWVRGYMDIIGLYDIMACRAMEMGLDRQPALAAVLRSAAEEPVLQAWFASVLRPRAVPDEEEVVAAWQANRAMLLVPERRRFEAVAAVGAEQSAALASMLSAGADPAGNAGLLSPVTALLEPGDSVLTRLLAWADLPEEASEKAFSLEPGEAAACTLQSGAILWLRLVEVVPEREASLEETRRQLTEMLERSATDSLLGVLVESLRVEYPCEVDSEFFYRFVRSPSGSIPAGSAQAGG